MDIPSITRAEMPFGDSSLKAGDVIRVKDLTPVKDGNFTFSHDGKMYQGNLSDTSPSRAASPQGSHNIRITSVAPALEFTVISVSGEKALSLNSLVNVEIVSFKDGVYQVVISGKTYSAVINPTPEFFRLTAEVIKSGAVLELKQTGISAKDVLLSFLAKETGGFNFKDMSSFAKLFSGSVLSSFLPEEIKRVLKDGGNFFENKLLKGVSATGDAKLSAYLSDNRAGGEQITKMQIANILMNEGFFSFFEGDDLDFDSGVMRIRRNEHGDINLWVKLTFTNIGETAISFVKTPADSYYVTVRSEKDISKAMENIKVNNCQICWRKLTEKDKQIFTPSKDDLILPSGFDMKI